MLTKKWCSRFAAVIVPIVFLLVSSCSDNPADPQADSFVINGIVTDSSGEPVADALILLDLSVELSTNASRFVRFDLPEADHVRIDLLNWCRDEVYMSQEMDLQAGQYTIGIASIDADGKELTDGAMWILVTTSPGVDELRFFLSRNVEGQEGDYLQWDYPFVLEQVRAQAITDSNGRYEIVDPCLGLGEEVAEGTIAWRVRAWAYHADFVEGAASTWADLDQNTGGTADIVIQ